MAELLPFPVTICLHRPIYESGISEPPWGCWVWFRSGDGTSLSSYFPRNTRRMGLLLQQKLMLNFYFAFSSMNREEETAVKTLEPAAEIHLSSLRVTQTDEGLNSEG